MHVFPDIKFDPARFHYHKCTPPHNFSLNLRSLDGNSKDVNSRRNFFLEFASAKGFDPLNPSFWYSVTTDEILANKVRVPGYKEFIDDIVQRGEAVLLPYQGSFGKALLHLFPEIGLDGSKFGKLPRIYLFDNVDIILDYIR